MSDKKAYCGIGEVPSKKYRGTSEECVNNNQIRYYGLKKIDPEILKNNKKKLDKMDVKLAKLNIKMKAEYQEWKYENNEKKKKKLGEKLSKMADEFVDLRKERNILDKKLKKLKLDEKK